jgi:DNA-directed RNA polymerase sigma subunit (sigma70/sigma32)
MIQRVGVSRGARKGRDDTEEAALRSQSRSYGRLRESEESALLALRPDPRATEKLVQHNLDLVLEQADGHANQGLGFADLYQEGALGLVDAVAAYDGRGGFRKFANLHVGLQMDALLEIEAGARKLDEAAVSDALALDLAQAALRREGGDPSDEDMAAALGWDVARVQRVAAALDLARERYDESLVDYLEDEDD